MAPKRQRSESTPIDTGEAVTQSKRPPRSKLNGGQEANKDGVNEDEKERIPIPGPSTVKLSPLACFRESPYPCINQKLVDDLQVIRQARRLNYGGDHPKCMGYANAISAIIACPYEIRSGKDAEPLPKVGPKVLIKIEEFLQTGEIKEARKLQNDPRMNSLRAFTEVHGIGSTIARQLYDQGLRTLDDLRSTKKWNFKYHDDLQLRMTREEVQSVINFIQLQLDRIEPGAHMVACGGYRRGKPTCKDVDLIITFPHQEGKERGILQRLVHRLQVKGFIPPDGILHLSDHASHRTTVENKPTVSLDSLDKAFIIFKHPANSTTRPKDVYRRVDLIVSRWGSWGCAIVGWSGSTMFEKDIRMHAHTLGFKFDSGGIRTRQGNQPVEAVTEEDVFRVLKVPWIGKPNDGEHKLYAFSW